MDTQEYERLAEKYLDCIYRVAVNECHSLWRSGWKRHTTYLEDGTVQYSTTLDVQEEDSVSVVVTEDAEVSNPTCNMGTEDAETSSEVIEVAEEDGRIYLLAGDMKLDITEDMSDGTASGSYEKNGVTFEYEVKEQPGAPGCYELHILSEEK